MRAALTLAIVGMLAGAASAQVGTWEAEHAEGSLTLHLDADGSMWASAVIQDTGIPEGEQATGYPLTVEYSGTWDADGDTLRFDVDPATVTFNGLTPEEQVDQVVAQMVALIEELTGEQPTADEIAEAREQILADLELGIVPEALAFAVDGDTLTLTDAEGTAVVLTRRDPDTAVQATTWGAVKARKARRGR